MKDIRCKRMGGMSKTLVHTAKAVLIQLYCSGHVRLTGGSSRCTGTVEFFNDGQWGGGVSSILACKPGVGGLQTAEL